MTNDKQPVIIKKYANRRLYNTGTSAYVTLENLAIMVKRGEDFVVYDAKTGDDITRSVLAQIIFEQEGKDGQSLLPITFLRQLIRFYGDSMQMLVPTYLEFTIDKLTSEQARFREKVRGGFGAQLTAPIFASLEEQARKNMALFNQALAMFTPFAGQVGGQVGGQVAGQASSQAEPQKDSAPEEAGRGDIDEMKRQLEELQKRIERLGSKD